MFSKRRLIIAVLTVAYLIGIFWLVDLKDVAEIIPKLPITTLLAVSGFAILAHVFALARSRTALQALHVTVNWKDIYLAFAVGNLATLAFNVFGQSLSRAVVLQSAGVPFGITVLATYIERVLAAGILFSMSLIAAWLLFSGVEIDLYQGIGDLIVSACGIVAVTATVTILALRTRALENTLQGVRLILRLWPSAVWTVFALGAGLASYLVLFRALDPASISIKLVAALTIVMLATSLPISFAGFGLRELSAAATLAYIGVAPATAVAASVLVGIIYIIIAALLGLGAVPLASNRTVEHSPYDSGTVSISKPTLNDKIIIQSLSIACALLIFFRVRAPVSGREVLININVADLIIFVALTVIALMIATGRLRGLFTTKVLTALMLMSSAIAGGLIAAFYYGHLGGWAIYTRGWGWIILLGYASLGAATTRFAGDEGRTNVVNVLTIASVTICVIQLVLLLIHLFKPLPYFVVNIPLAGFAHNQNAFALDLVTTGLLLIAAKHCGALRDRHAVFLACMAAVTAVTFLTESRTAIVFMLMLAVMDFLFSLYLKKSGRFATSGATCFVVAVFLILAIVVPVSTNAASHAARPVQHIQLSQSDGPVETTRLSHPHADHERLDTIVGGLEAWRKHPIFGAGIGSYFEGSRRVSENPKSIHSIYVWFLSETGLVGLFALLASAGLLVHAALRALTRASFWGFTALGSLTLMGVGGLVQDFSFQRIFWFVLGLSLAKPESAQGDSGLRDRIFLGALVSFGALILLLWHWPK